MTARKVGRNDPCPCGSGKKYKHCCLRKDQRRRRSRTVTSPPRPVRRSDGMLGAVRGLTRRLTQGLPDDEARELQEQANRMEEIETYLDMQDQIEAASETLEAHRPEFEEMMADAGSAMERAYRLFSEERFVPLRYTPDDLGRAFEAVGYPADASGELSDEEMEAIVAVTIHLAGDQKQRLRLTRRLLMTLPEYVDAGRYRDAWLIQYSAFRLTEVSEESNPFMFVMFQLAYEEWVRQIEEEQVTLLEELGIDRAVFRQGDVADVFSLTRDISKDPEKMARIEAFYASHPAEHEGTEARLLQLEEEAVELFERDDAESLLLSVEEVGPWLPQLVDRVGPGIEATRAAVSVGQEPDPAVQERVLNAFVVLIEEMVPEIYTQERIDELVQDVQDYRRRLVEAGEEEAVGWADGAMVALYRDLPPSDNRFLKVHCYASLRAIFKAAAEDHARTRDSSEGHDA